MGLLHEIIDSKNDNDPRLDSEFVQMSPELRKTMVQYYHRFPLEKRNERGTVVFLIAKNIASSEDLEFLKTVLHEKPCLSLGNCSELAQPATGEEIHLEGMSETTASYPELTAVQQMLESYQRLKNESANPTLAVQILETLREGLNSPNQKVRDATQNALVQIKN